METNVKLREKKERNDELVCEMAGWVCKTVSLKSSTS